MSTNPSTPALGLVPPNGLDQILATFGDIFDYIGPDHTLNPRWQNEFLQRIALLFPIPLSWDMSRRVNQITCHKRLADVFTANLPPFRLPACKTKSSASADASRFAATHWGEVIGTFMGHRSRPKYRN
jgi:hypothetical protein